MFERTDLDRLTVEFNFLKGAVSLFTQRDLSPLEERGAIRGMLLVSELAWKVLHRYLKYIGVKDSRKGSKDTVRVAYREKLIDNIDLWFRVIEDRNTLSREYNSELATKLVFEICQYWLDEVEKLIDKLEMEIIRD